MNGYQFIVCTSAQWDDVQRLGLDIGAPRVGPDGRFLTNLNGNLPFNNDDLTFFASIGVEIVPSDMIAAWLESNGWNQ